MCYSPEASFAVGSVLAIVGVGAIRKALQYDRTMLMFSLFPAIFSLHQFLEGVVWLSVDGAFDGKIFRYLYIYIAVSFVARSGAVRVTCRGNRSATETCSLCLVRCGACPSGIFGS